jgi:pyruvate dehydrogenase E2 component (dihydrolipoamide acetyltransferase)
MEVIMAKFVVMPKLGLTMTEGIITKWFKKEGDRVEKGEKLFEAETDKLTNEVEATESGVLRKILHMDGAVKVLENVAIIGEENEDISELVGAQKSEDTSVKTVEVQEGKSTASALNFEEKSAGRIKATPKAKKLAGELGIDLSLVKGTGPQGAITDKDINEYKEGIAKVKISPAAEKLAEKLEVDPLKISKQERIMKVDVTDYWNLEMLKEMAQPEDKEAPMTTMRKVISRRMWESQNTAATVSYSLSVDTTEMTLLRDKLVSEWKLSYTDILVKILSRVLLEHPLLNSSIYEDKITTRNYVNIGVAVALKEGLIVPVVKYANIKGLKAISREIKELVEKAKNNELSPEEISGGTFTITNLGMFGMESFTPIINQPESAILGVNTIIKTPIVINDEIVIKPMMTLSLTADHRIVDGSVAALFMKRLKESIENPNILFL